VSRRRKLSAGRHRLGVRRARTGDLDQLVEMWQELHTGHYAYDRDYYRLRPVRRAKAEIRKHFAARMADPDAIFLVAARGPELAGFLMGTLSTRPPVMPRTRRFTLDSAFVAPELRGTGVFSKLFARLKRILAGLGDVKHVELSVDVRNPAVAAYGHLGFEKLHYKMVHVLGSNRNASESPRPNQE